MLKPGASIFAKVIATNDIGDSPISEAGNGAVFVWKYVPDAPVLLSRDPITTTTT